MAVVDGNAAKADGTTDGREPGLTRLLLRGAVFTALLVAAVLSILVIIPDGNDYARAAGLKNQRLQSLEGPKIVLIGGSNLAFGIDSRIIEAESSCHVANMGMNGYFGLRYMLSEAASGLQRGDVAVIALEYDNFVKSVEGTATDLLMIAKTNPSTMRHMSADQLARAASQIPFVVRSKVERLADEAAQAAYDALLDSDGPDGSDAREAGLAAISRIESLAGFTPEGDLVSHLDVTWPFPREEGLDLSSLPVDPGLVPLLQEFGLAMSQRGVDVIFSYTPLARPFHERHARAIEGFDALIRDRLGDLMHVPSRPTAFVYDEDRFFDTVYHLNRDGRGTRSLTLAGDITQRQGPSEQCRGYGQQE